MGTAKMLKPFLNKWLRGFRNAEAPDDDADKEDVVVAEAYEKPRSSILSSCSDEFDDLLDDPYDDIGNREVVCSDEDLDLGYFDPTISTNLKRKASKHDCVKKTDSGELIKAKSGEGIPVAKINNEEKQARRREVRRAAVKRLGDGQIVH